MNFWQTEEWKEYLLNDGTGYIDRSFFIDGKFVPLLQLRDEFYSPGFEDNKLTLLAIESAAERYGIKRIQVDSLIKSYLQIPSLTCVVDPFVVKTTKGHKSAIARGMKFLDFISVNTLSGISAFKDAYFEIAGKQTRPLKTFEILYNWIWDGYGTLLEATIAGETAGFAYIIHNEGYAYYFMSCAFDKYRDYCVTHYLQAVAFDILKDKNIHHYELGEQVYNSLFHQPSEKEMNISI